MAGRVGVTFRFPEKVPPYEAALRAAGLEPIRITPAAPREIDGLDGLVVTGGTDVDPALYGQERDPLTGEPDRARDDLEMRLIDQALNRDLPMLCICRGMQILNVALGGDLVQDLGPDSPHPAKPAPEARARAVHAVGIVPGTLLEAVLGPGDHQVNSRHHQSVGRLGRGLVVSAQAPDGIVEACELPDRRFVLAVQWHPEDRVEVDARDRRLFEALAARAGRQMRGL